MESSFVPLMAYLLVQPLILMFYADKTSDMVDATGTAWKLAVYIFVLCFIAKKYLKKEYFIKTIRIIGVFSSIYGINVSFKPSSIVAKRGSPVRMWLAKFSKISTYSVP